MRKWTLGILEFERNSVKRNFGNEIPQELSFKVVTETEWKELQPFSRTEPNFLIGTNAESPQSSSAKAGGDGYAPGQGHAASYDAKIWKKDSFPLFSAQRTCRTRRQIPTQKHSSHSGTEQSQLSPDTEQGRSSIPT